jgi:hypothetical protein
VLPTIRPALAVKFQQVVVHSAKNWEADVAKRQTPQEAEWTITIMLDLRFMSRGTCPIRDSGPTSLKETAAKFKLGRQSAVIRGIGNFHLDS